MYFGAALFIIIIYSSDELRGGGRRKLSFLQVLQFDGTLARMINCNFFHIDTLCDGA